MLSSTDDNDAELSKPISASRSVTWAVMKTSGDKRVKLVVDRMTPVIDLEPPPKDAHDLGATAHQLAKPTLPAGYSPDYPKANPWLVWEWKTLTHRYNNIHKDGKMQRRLHWKSARSSEWRRKHWGVRKGGGTGTVVKQKTGSPGPPADIVGDKAIARFYSVLQSTLAYFSHLNAPDPDLKKDWVSYLFSLVITHIDIQPWVKESTALAKEVVRHEFADQPDQYNYHATNWGKPYAQLFYYAPDGLSPADSKAKRVKTVATKPAWSMRYQFGVIGNPLTSGRSVEEMSNANRPRITLMAETMVHGKYHMSA